MSLDGKHPTSSALSRERGLKSYFLYRFPCLFLEVITNSLIT
jgi:hypothetical protein